MVQFIVYMVLLVILSLLCFGLVLFPFWKVFVLIRTRHPHLWEGMGRPLFQNLFSDAEVRTLFVRVINLSEFSREEIEDDQDLVNYTRLCKTIFQTVPDSAFWRVFWGMFVLFLLGMTASKIMGIFI